MGLARDRTVRHRSGREALDDRNGGLDLVQRHGRSRVFLGRLDAEEAAHRQKLRALLVEQLGEGVVAFAGVAANGMLEQRNRLRGPIVGLAAHPIGVFAADFERRAQNRRIAERVRVPALSLLRDLRETRALDRGRGAEEEFVDERAREADSVENLRAAIGLVGRNAHLRHDLEQALVDRLDEALDRLITADRLRQVLGHRRQRLKRQIRIDRFGAVAGETGEMMDLPRLAGFDHEADGGAKSLADEVMMDGCRRQKGRNRNSVRSYHAIG